MGVSVVNRFIELTDMAGKPVWVGTGYVTHVEPPPDCEEDRANALVHVAAGGDGLCFWVQETPWQVLARLRGLP